MDQITVSIIIPVYNTEKYLKKCMTSILRQDYPALEILLVNDGSTDSCPALCNHFAQKYTDISVIHQANQGLWAARNTGILHAKGDYLLFVDSDDRLDGSHAVSLLVKKAVQTNADIVTGCFRRLTDQGCSGVNRHHLQSGDYSRTVDFRFKGFFMYGHLAYNWGKLYRKDFLLQNDLLCPPYPFMQDKPHNMACCVCQPVYAFVDESVYLYRVNEASVTFQYKASLPAVWIAVAEDFQKLCAGRNISETYGDLIAFHLFFGAFFLVKQELQSEKHGIISSARELKAYGENPLVKKYMKLLSQGNYVREIEPISWKLVIRLASFFLKNRRYLLLVLGIALLRIFRIDGRITRARYK